MYAVAEIVLVTCKGTQVLLEANSKFWGRITDQNSTGTSSETFPSVSPGHDWKQNPNA